MTGFISKRFHQHVLDFMEPKYNTIQYSCEQRDWACKKNRLDTLCSTHFSETDFMAEKNAPGQIEKFQVFVQWSDTVIQFHIMKNVSGVSHPLKKRLIS